MLKNRVKKLEITCKGLEEGGETIPIMTQMTLISMGVMDEPLTRWTPHLREVWAKYPEELKKSVEAWRTVNL